MQGLSPRPSSLTPQQIQTSTQISVAIPELPITLSDLISEMAAPDFSIASQALELDQDEEVIQNQRNLKIISYIKLALTATSTECDPSIKSAIIQNAKEPMNYCLTFGRLRPYLAKILNELKAGQLQINLDDVVIKDMIMFSSGGINLGGMSAKRARFENVNMYSLELSKADFTGARFVEVNLSKADLSYAHVVDASFFSVWFKDTLACGLTGNQTAIYGVTQTSTSARLPEKNSGSGMVSTTLFGNGITAFPDRTIFTLPAQITEHPMPASGV